MLALETQPPRQHLASLHKLLAMAMVAILWFTAQGACARPDILHAGETAPNWMLRDSQGEPVLLYEQIEKSAVTVMFFWASWCQKCSELLPELQNLAQATAPEAATFFTLNIWEDKDPEEHLAALGVTLPLLAKAESVAQRYGVGGTPSLIVVDANRKILLSQQAGDINDIQRQVGSLLANYPIQSSATAPTADNTDSGIAAKRYHTPTATSITPEPQPR